MVQTMIYAHWTEVVGVELELDHDGNDDDDASPLVVHRLINRSL